MQDLGFRFQCRKCGPKCMYPEKKSGFIKIRNVNLSTQTVDEPKKKLAISILKKWNCTSLNMKMPQRLNVYRLKLFLNPPVRACRVVFIWLHIPKKIKNPNRISKCTH